MPTVTAAEVGNYIRKLFSDHVLVAISAAGAFLYKALFPEQAYLYAAAATLGIMVLDLATKLYALSKQSGGLRKAVRGHRITSTAFAKGTLDKLLVFGVMLIICGLAYRITPVAGVAVWFTQLIFTLMFLRDLLSIIENLIDAGVSGLSVLKRAVQKKMSEYGVDEEDPDDHH